MNLIPHLTTDSSGSWIPKDRGLFVHIPTVEEKQKINLSALECPEHHHCNYKGKQLLISLMILHEKLFNQRLLNKNAYMFLVNKKPSKNQDVKYILDWIEEMKQIQSNVGVIVELFELGNYILQKGDENKLTEYWDKFEGVLHGNHSFGEGNIRDAIIYLTKNITGWNRIKSSFN